MAAPRHERLLSGLREAIGEHGLFRGADRVLVACSGGPDSVALLDGLVRTREDHGAALFVASVDHGLRPDAAEEVAFVGALAARLGVPFFPLRLRVPREGASVLARAREERYRALHALARELGALRIAVGHTLDDQAETVLDRVLRGAGVRGLSGVKPLREDGVVRPLLGVSRAEVLAYLETNGLAFVEDPSNRDHAFRRVRLRHGILPALRAEDPAVTEHLADLAEEARDIDAFLTGVARDWLASQARITEADTVAPAALSRAALKAAASPVARAAVLEWIRQRTGRDVGRAQARALSALIATGRGHVLLGGGWAAAAHGDALRLEHRAHWPTRTNPRPCGEGDAAPEDSCDGSASLSLRAGNTPAEAAPGDA